MTGLRLERPSDATAFLALAGDFLVANEAENNLALGISANVAADPTIFGEPARFAVAADAAGAVRGAALQTPPFNVVLTYGTAPEAVQPLAEAFAEFAVPGVNGPVELALRFAEVWRDTTGQPFEPGFAERIFRLQKVTWPKPADGEMRPAEPWDKELIVDWLMAFAAEALGEELQEAEAAADRWIARRYRTLYLWEDHGEVVSLAGAGGPVIDVQIYTFSGAR